MNKDERIAYLEKEIRENAKQWRKSYRPLWRSRRHPGALCWFTVLGHSLSFRHSCITGPEDTFWNIPGTSWRVRYHRPTPYRGCGLEKHLAELKAEQ